MPLRDGTILRAAIAGAPWIAENFLPPAAPSFQFDADFLAVGGAAVALMWTLNFLLGGIVLFEGRWRPLTRKFDLALSTLWAGTLIWLALGPRIFLSATTDQAAKGWLSLVALLVLIDLGVKIYRHLQRPRTAAALAAIAKT